MKEYKSDFPEITLKLRKTGTFKRQIKNSQHVAEIFREIYEDSISIYESMFAVYLNRANNTIGWFRISQGGLSGTVVDQRLILKVALECLASSIILCHNHPSGSKQPSEADINTTKKVKQAAEIMDIKILDHVILTEDSYYSMADEGIL